MLEHTSCLCEIRLHFEAARQESAEQPLEFKDGGVSTCEFTLERSDPRIERLALFGSAAQPDRHRGFGGAAALATHQEVARCKLGELRLLAGTRDAIADPFAMRLEVRTAGIELRQTQQTPIKLSPGAGNRVFSDADFARNVTGLFFETPTTQRGFLGAGTTCLELTEQVRVSTMRLLNATLCGITTGFGDAERGASGRQRGFAAAHAVLSGRERCAQLLEARLTLEDTGVRVPAASDAQPAAAQPFAAAGDDGLAGRKVAPRRQRLGEAVGDVHGIEHFDGGSRAAYTRRQARRDGPRTAAARSTGATLEQGDPRAREPAQRIDQGVAPLDTDRLEVLAEHRLDGALPSGIDRQCLSEPGPLSQSGAAQPSRGTRVGTTERRTLQGFDRHRFGAGALTLGARGLDLLFEPELLGTQPLHIAERRGQSLCERVGRRACSGLALTEFEQLPLRLLREQRIAFHRQPVTLCP